MGRERTGLSSLTKLHHYQDDTAARRCPGPATARQSPFGHWKTQTFIAGLRHRCLTAPFVVDQPMNRRIFETWVETQLVPTLAKGDVVILDNLSAHKVERRGRYPCQGCLDAVPAALQPGPEPHRDGVLQAQVHLRARATRTIDTLWTPSGHLQTYSPPNAATTSKPQDMTSTEHPPL